MVKFDVLFSQRSTRFASRLTEQTSFSKRFTRETMRLVQYLRDVSQVPRYTLFEPLGDAFVDKCAVPLVRPPSSCPTPFTHHQERDTQRSKEKPLESHSSSPLRVLLS